MSVNKKMKLTETEEEVLSVINSRFKLGRERYGEGISYLQHKDDANYNEISRLDEAIEECADLLQYLVAARLMILEKRRGIQNG